VGGVVAYLFALRHPERVMGLVSVEGNFSLKDAFWSSSVARA
jgi:pimeloyl-ACP methyl ester carboxylesterase